MLVKQLVCSVLAVHLQGVDLEGYSCCCCQPLNEILCVWECPDSYDMQLFVDGPADLAYSWSQRHCHPDDLHFASNRRGSCAICRKLKRGCATVLCCQYNPARYSTQAVSVGVHSCHTLYESLTSPLVKQYDHERTQPVSHNAGYTIQSEVVPDP